MDADNYPNAVASAVAETQRNELADAARAALAREPTISARLIWSS